MPATSLRPQVNSNPGTGVCHEQSVLHKQEVGQHIHGEALPGHWAHHKHVGTPGCGGNEVALGIDTARVERALLMAAVPAGKWRPTRWHLAACKDMLNTWRYRDACGHSRGRHSTSHAEAWLEMQTAVQCSLCPSLMRMQHGSNAQCTSCAWDCWSVRWWGWMLLCGSWTGDSGRHALKTLGALQ